MSKFMMIDNVEEFIPVEDIYAFAYESGDGKVVLRLKIKSNIMTLERLINIFKEDHSIKVFEESEEYEMLPDGSTATEPTIVRTQTLTFEHFCRDFNCKYDNKEDIYEIEVIKKSATEIDSELDYNQILDGYEAMTDIYETPVIPE